MKRINAANEKQIRQENINAAVKHNCYEMILSIRKNLASKNWERLSKNEKEEYAFSDQFAYGYQTGYGVDKEVSSVLDGNDESKIHCSGFNVDPIRKEVYLNPDFRLFLKKDKSQIKELKQLINGYGFSVTYFKDGKTNNVSHLDLQNVGSTNKGNRYDIKAVADFLSENDNGRPDDGYFLNKILNNFQFVQENIKATYHSGTFLGFDCDFDVVFDELDS